MRENRTYGSAGVCGSNGAFYLLGDITEGPNETAYKEANKSL